LSRSLEQWLAYQQGAHGLSIDLSLERVREVAARLGLLDKRCPAVIIAGTNGKGSTAAALAALLQSCGQRVGPVHQAAPGALQRARPGSTACR
jgi:dihydrofolate synthase/folylpolyglutamate synthase